jgi:UDP-N-acetyl-D-glucosamine dehydrogenase
MDAVIIVTDHSDYDFAEIVKHSNLIIDTRNATKGIKGAKEKIVMA